ncbi:MAG: preprotein translocase subunit SecY [Actinomycetota bacterium]|jgi:preprotein translocase subunit SecY|nr:preprotein translocase subunit SecY [Actinomycetota bacterium]
MNLLQAFVNAFRVPDLRKKILFTVLIIAIYRLGSHIPTPGIDVQKAQQFSQGIQTGALSFINLFSGGALTQLAIFALGIMPYITSSIIMQLLTVVIPKLEAWSKEGESGYKKITQWTRYLTVGLAIMQSTGLAFLFHSGNITNNNGTPIDLIPNFNMARVALIVVSLTAGTALIMWLGELITTRGVGNGMSILIFTSIVSRLPSSGHAILAQKGWGTFSFILLMGIGVIVAIVIMEQGQRRIPVQYAKRMVGRRMYGGSSTYIPLKVNQAGVIPIIFASSVLYIPTLLQNVIHSTAIQNFISNTLVNSASPVYMILYGLMVVFFAYFYTAITFNPVEVADNMKQYGGFVPGIRPGRQTAEYLDRILTRITLPGAIFIAAIALLPSIFFATQNIKQLPFGGTSILITVGVTLETMKQIESQLLMRHYEGFLK